MTSTTKRGFHLPWAGDARKPEVGSADEPSPETPDDASDPGAERSRPSLRREILEDLGSGPFGLSPVEDRSAAAQSNDDPLVAVEDRAPVRSLRGARPLAPVEAAAEPAAEAVTEAPVDPDPPATSATEEATDPSTAWPDVDRAGSPTHVASDAPPIRPRLVAESGNGTTNRAGRKENPLVAGLVKAMRDAARSTRQDAMARMRASAATRVEEIRVQAAAEAVALRKRADDDVLAIREWSKAEMTRIREETDQKIAGRRAQLAREARVQSGDTERLMEEIKATTERFEAEMDAFFQALLAEDDPARLAALAERLPETPVFQKIVVRSPSASPKSSNGSGRTRTPKATTTAAPRRKLPSQGRATAAKTTETPVDVPDPESAVSAAPVDDVPERLEPDAAAAAEAEAIAGLDLDAQAEPDWSTGSLASFLATAEKIDSPDDLSPEERLAVLGSDADADAQADEADPLAAMRAAFAAVEAASMEAPDERDAADGPAPVDASPQPSAPVAEPVAQPVVEPVAPPAAAAAPHTTADPLPQPESQARVVVTGLTSVAGISAFKGALSRLPGVASVSVTSGAEDDFVFAVNHTGSLDLRAAVPTFNGFSAHLTSDEEGVLTFAVTEPAA
jgi:hypothetical protein